MVALMVATIASVDARITLIGNNDPHGVIADGDFNDVWSGFRAGKQPPFWSIKNNTSDDGKSTFSQKMGLHYGNIFSSTHATAISKPLDQNPQYTEYVAGDRLMWDFAADVEYRGSGTLSLSLLFGKHERMLAERVTLIGSDLKYELFDGSYTITEEDARAGAPSIKVEFFSSNEIKVMIDYINIYVESKSAAPPKLSAAQVKDGSNRIELTWQDLEGDKQTKYNIYRAEINPSSKRDRVIFKAIGESNSCSFIDEKVVSGRPYTYSLTRLDTETGTESRGSQRVTISTSDTTPPSPPADVKLTPYDSEVGISWSKNRENDIAYYSIERVDESGVRKVISNRSVRNSIEDILAPKQREFRYELYAHDYSGNRSEATLTEPIVVRAVEGSSFNDLIKPMPLRGELRSDLWGAESVLPRDANNGIEAPEWSYWGGRPVKDRDGRYHMVVTRWSESALKGHWEWSKSTVAHVTSDNPIGPYKVISDIAYDYKDGRGHNPDIILMADGSYALYSLIDWKPMIFTSPSMSGPWSLLGELSIDTSWATEHFETVANDKNTYQYERNLSGVVNDDGSITIVSKFGAMMRSTNGLLGPYKLLTQRVQFNETIPERHRKLAYEDPVMWRDSVQYHLLINAFLDKRAIYLRSGDGINWVCDPGVAYTPEVTNYEDGTSTRWDKLERPHVLQDEHGRAVVLSLAAIDVDKALDFGSDKHSSKNLMIPLRPLTLLRLMNKRGVDGETKRIVVRILSEEGFDATTDVDLSSLRFGSASLVDYGGGGELLSSRTVDGDLEVIFDGTKSGVKDDDFALKLIGRRKDGEIMVGYTKLKP